MTRFSTSASLATFILVIAIGIVLIRARDSQAGMSEEIDAHTIPFSDQQLALPREDSQNNFSQSFGENHKLQLDTPIRKI